MGSILRGKIKGGIKVSRLFKVVCLTVIVFFAAGAIFAQQAQAVDTAR